MGPVLISGVFELIQLVLANWRRFVKFLAFNVELNSFYADFKLPYVFFFVLIWEAKCASVLILTFFYVCT